MDGGCARLDARPIPRSGAERAGSSTEQSHANRTERSARRQTSGLNNPTRLTRGCRNEVTAH
jgi:hypothetical protein